MKSIGDRYEVRKITRQFSTNCGEGEIIDIVTGMRASSTVVLPIPDAKDVCDEMNAAWRRMEQPEIDKTNYEFLESFATCVDVDQLAEFLLCVTGLETAGDNTAVYPPMRDATNRVIARWLRDHGHLPKARGVARGVHKTSGTWGPWGPEGRPES